MSAVERPTDGPDSAQCTATMTEPMGPKTGTRGVCRCYLPAVHVFSTDRDEHGMPVDWHRCECSMSWLDDLQVAEARERRAR